MKVSIKMPISIGTLSFWQKTKLVIDNCANSQVRLGNVLIWSVANVVLPHSIKILKELSAKTKDI